MKQYNPMIEIDEQTMQIQCAMAILDEACHYMEPIDERQSLPRYAEHILLLLMAVRTSLYNTNHELTAIVRALETKSA